MAGSRAIKKQHLMKGAKEEILQEGKLVHKIMAAALKRLERASPLIYKSDLQRLGNRVLNRLALQTPRIDPSPQTFPVAFVLLTPFPRLARQSGGRKNSNVAGKGMSSAGRGTVSAVPKEGTAAETSLQARITPQALNDTVAGGSCACLDDHTGNGVCLR